jgi:DNA-binding protein HU-beta
VANITKAELLDKVAGSSGVSKADAEKVLGSFFDAVIAAGRSHDKVSWPGFGSFQGRRKPAGTARNPATGKTIKTAARNDIKFTKSSTLKDSLNSKGATKKAAAKKSAATKSPAKKAAAKKTTAKKATAKKATKRR